MLRLKNLSNKYQKRLIRPEYAQTQATPYAASLHSSFRDADGNLVLPADGATTPLNTRTDKGYTLKNSLIPGVVMVRVGASENVAVATGVPHGTSAALAEQPFGLLANFVGGDLDEGFSGDSLQNEVGVWRGPDSTYTLLAPAFNDAGLDTDGAAITNAQSITAAIAAAATGDPVLLYAGPDGRLTSYSTVGNRKAVARLISRPDASKITIDLIV